MDGSAHKVSRPSPAQPSPAQPWLPYLPRDLTATAKLSYQRISVSTGVSATTPPLRSPPPKNGDFYYSESRLMCRG
ncbi:hypothetical protein FANTH_10855 [Fusarium anthophilum]|uniref:Uncharacterized protein n=1 Tax=Fusarium anthophilum TaxID=48485 RepID=A0A8H5DVF4_9HYPO|nr:hypothetical protein FANTH_10855 [Fusarium anthophilum]